MEYDEIYVYTYADCKLCKKENLLVKKRCTNKEYKNGQHKHWVGWKFTGIIKSEKNNLNIKHSTCCLM